MTIDQMVEQFQPRNKSESKENLRTILEFRVEVQKILAEAGQPPHRLTVEQQYQRVVNGDITADADEVAIAQRVAENYRRQYAK